LWASQSFPRHAIVASTDAHSARGLTRGWATAADIVNTRPLKEVLARKKPGS
jgi:hypothetical protein